MGTQKHKASRIMNSFGRADGERIPDRRTIKRLIRATGLRAKDSLATKVLRDIMNGLNLK